MSKNNWNKKKKIEINEKIGDENGNLRNINVKDTEEHFIRKKISLIEKKEKWKAMLYFAFFFWFSCHHFNFEKANLNYLLMLSFQTKKKRKYFSANWILFKIKYKKKKIGSHLVSR